MYAILLKNLAVSMAVGATLGSTTPVIDPKAITATTSYNTGSSIMTSAATAPAAEARESAMDIWLDKLVQLESEGKEDIKILDSNGHYSYGCLQFQEYTFRAYASAYGLFQKKADIEPAIYNCDLQKKVAKKMLIEDAGNWRHWFTSVKSRGLGLPPRSDTPLADVAK